MIDDAVLKFDIDVSKSWLIGDKSSDIMCAKNSGILNTIQVKTGHEFNEKESIANYVLDSIKQSVDIIT